jgi:antitoxin component YwqK of YwqJK toxin-antitoxin module
MAWCPNCRIETSDSETFCARCGINCDSLCQRYQVVGIPKGHNQSDRTVVSSFNSRSKAEDFAAFVRRGGKFQEVVIVDSHYEQNLLDSLPSGGADRKSRWKWVVVFGIAVSFLLLLLLTLWNKNGNPRVGPVADAEGPATSPQKQEPVAPVRESLPDFSKLDYSVDFSKLDYSVGPKGQVLVERPGPDRVDRFPSTQQGFLLAEGEPRPEHAMGGNAPERKKANSRTSENDRFVLHGRYTVFYPKGFGSAFTKEPIVEPRQHSQQFYFNGVRHGTYTEWNTDGNMLLRVCFRDGIKHGWLEKWSAAGKKILDEPYFEGKLHGIVMAWNDDGSQKMKGAWVNGRREGPLVETSSGSEVITDWINGEVVFCKGRSSSHEFIWKMKTSADAIRNDGQLIFHSVDRFMQIFGQPTLFRELENGRQYFFSCSDGQFGIILLWDFKGGCQIPMRFEYLRSAP